jgi:hypothetical protein
MNATDLTEKTLRRETRRIGTVYITVQHVQLHTIELGTWHIWRWRSTDGETGSYPECLSFLIFDDVFDQLYYEFVDSHQLETVIGPYGDADPGL